MKTRITETIVETEEILTVRLIAAPVRGRCAQCGEEVEMAATCVDVIERLVKAGALHYTETAEGEMRICLRSLSAQELAHYERRK